MFAILERRWGKMEESASKEILAVLALEVLICTEWVYAGRFEYLKDQF